MEEICDVCGQPLDEENVARCALCGRRFHLAWSIHAQVENCGRVCFDNRSWSMVFVCHPCLAQHPELSQSLMDAGQQPPF